MRVSVAVLGILVLISVLDFALGANILFFFAVGTYSHRITVWPLVEKLVERGHNVTFIQPYHPKKPNPKVHEFFPLEFQKHMEGRNRVTDGEHDLLNERILFGTGHTYKIVSVLANIALKVCDKLIQIEDTVKFANSSQFDLVILDGLFNECGLGFAHKFGAKVMIFGTTSLFAWDYDPFGVPVESSWIPELHMSFQYPMTFIQKVMSTLIVPLNYAYRLWFYYPKLENILRKGLEIPDMPPLAELEQNISLILLNTHSSEEFGRSLPPFVVPIGGMHLESVGEEGKKKSVIPENILNFIDGSGESGFLFVSFGSMAKISNAPEALQKTFYNVFRESKTRFVWKWEGKRPAEMPDNVLTADWMPQQEILSHPKIKGFITHGGLMSIQEAILSAVPMIVFPIFAEQDYNAFRIERMGRGIRLEIAGLTSEQLRDAIQEILTNQSYKENMRKTSVLFKDRPQSPLTTAVWWTEYVIRSPDVSHLKPLSMHESWFQRRLLDVWLFLFCTSSLAVVLIYYFLRKLCTFVSFGLNNNGKGLKKHLD